MVGQSCIRFRMSQFRAKRNKYDVTFSEFILLRDQTCQWCLKRPATECSHIHSRSNMGTRCDPRNAMGKCNYCHRKWHSFPLLAAEWCRSIMGENEYFKLLRLAKTPSKMSVFDKDFIRKEQQELIATMKKGEFPLKQWSKMFR